MSDAFYYVEWDEDCDWDESYDMLRGPDGFECLLTEPEDRIWLRDGRPVIEKLNEQAVTIATLTARLAAAEAERDVERRDRTAAEFEMLADRELLRELYEHEINEYGRWTAGMCQRVCVAAKGWRDGI